MITKELKARWLEALRSGKFHHLSGGYRSHPMIKVLMPEQDKVCHCALGVLLEITDAFNEPEYSGRFLDLELVGLGVSHADQSEIIYLNDRNLDFEPNYDEAIKYIENLDTQLEE